MGESDFITYDATYHDIMWKCPQKVGVYKVIVYGTVQTNIKEY